MGKKLKRPRMENEPRGPSDDDGMPPEETALPRRCSEARRKKGKMLQILVKFKDEMTSEMRKLLKEHIESNNNQSIMLCKNLENLAQTLEKLSESHNDLRKQLENHTNAPRSHWNPEQPPRYRLIFRSKVTGKIEKGETIEIHVALVDVNNGQTVKNGPLASATVELVVIDAKFNENDNQYSWSREDFVSNIKKAPQGNSATVNVDQSVKSIVSNGRFNLENGDKRHCDFIIFSNSGNKRVRLGVMVVSPTQERVLEGLSNPFFVQGHDRPNRKQARVDNGNQEQNGPIPNIQSPNSTQAEGNRSVITPVLGRQYQPPFPRSNPVLYTEPATIQQHQVPHRSMLAQAPNSQTDQVSVDNGNQDQNDPMYMQTHSCPNSIQADGNGSFITPMLGGQHQPLSQRNTPVLSTEPATSQQHQVLDWSMLAQASNNRTVQDWVDNGNQEQNGPMSNMQNPSCPNSTQADGNGPVITPMFGGQHQPLLERNTPVLSTEPATSQQHQVPRWPMLAQASNNPTGLNAIGQTLSQFTGNDVAYTESSASQVQEAWMPQNQDHWPNITHQPMNNGTGTFIGCFGFKKPEQSYQTHFNFNHSKAAAAAAAALALAPVDAATSPLLATNSASVSPRRYGQPQREGPSTGKPCCVDLREGRGGPTPAQNPSRRRRPDLLREEEAHLLPALYQKNSSSSFLHSRSVCSSFLHLSSDYQFCCNWIFWRFQCNAINTIQIVTTECSRYKRRCSTSTFQTSVHLLWKIQILHGLGSLGKLHQLDDIQRGPDKDHGVRCQSDSLMSFVESKLLDLSELYKSKT